LGRSEGGALPPTPIASFMTDTLKLQTFINSVIMTTTTTIKMESFTVDDFQKHFDELLERVENGESFIIKSEYGNAMIIPYGDCKNGDFFCDHDDGC
jgi:hypothetical protein